MPLIKGSHLNIPLLVSKEAFLEHDFLTYLKCLY